MKILYICSTLKQSGPTHQLFGLVKHVRAQGASCIVITISEEPEDSKLSDFLTLGAEHHCLQVNGWRFWVSRHQKLKKLVQSIAPDIIHTSGIRADFLSASFFKAYLTISTIHNIPWEDYRFRYGGFVGAIMLRAHVSFWSKLKVCVGVSENSSGFIAERYPFLPVIAIPNGIDIEVYNESASSARQVGIKKNSEIDKGKGYATLEYARPVFISTEEISTLKNSLTLIEGFIRYKQLGGAGTLLFVGDGPLRSEATALAGERDDIVFRGRTSDVVSYYRSADYFLSASRSEGLPLAFLEAMSCRLIPVVSDIGPRHEVLQNHAFARYMFDPDNPEQLAENLLKASKDDPSAHAAFFEDIRKRYSDREMARKYLETYRKLLK
jgi:glycosyltransferase involved in cell wall biosynthesis